MFFDLLEKIPELLKMSWDFIVKASVGAFLIGFFAWNWVRSIRKTTKALIRAEEHRIQAELEKERAEFHQKIAEMKTQHAEDTLHLREEMMQSEQDRNEAERERTKIAEELSSLQDRLTALESFDGKLWEQDNTTPHPLFVTAAERHTRFISVVNLKGGVGKTTLTSNIGVSLARRNHRVLLVDLDFQGSLTRLCTADPDQLLDIIQKKKTAARLLDGKADPELLDEVTQPIRHPNLLNHICDFIPADESLAEAELRAQALWLITKTPDARFLFRQLFHSKHLLSKYDFVLFDCPPRLTTACVNALGCSDFLLVPVLLEQGSVEALPRTINWLTRLPHVSRAKLLGVVANRVDFYGPKPVSSQQAIYAYLPETLKRFGFHGDDIFHAIIKNSRKIEEVANKGQIAATQDVGADLFAEVTSEIEKGVQR